MPQLHNTLDANGNRIANLPAPAAANDPARLADLNSAIEGLAWKDDARVATQANVTLSGPGATIDGVTMAANDRVLVRAQTAPAENGLYLWNGAATPMTRSPDASTADELKQAVVTVAEGASAGATFRQSSVNFTLGTDAVVWGSFGTSAPPASETTPGIAEVATQPETDAGTDDERFVTALKLANWSGRLRKTSQTIGDGSATAFNIDHNFNTRAVTVEVFRNSGSYDTVLADVTRPSVNRVTVTFAAAPASNGFSVVVAG